MKNRKQKVKPTNAELEILQVLWEHGSGTVKFVHEQLNEKRGVGYTTTLKIMQNMTEKNMVKRKREGRGHVYFPAIEMEDTQNELLDRFLDIAFAGSASSLVMQLLDHHETSAEELKKIKKLISKLEGGK